MRENGKNARTRSAKIDDDDDDDSFLLAVERGGIDIRRNAPAVLRHCSREQVRRFCNKKR